ncbi:hypothetical protein ACWOFR_09095 [Carnobacterium gallinarum]|uniref:hypothetical protein n=1 Tax=Carnobacterium gallinarum TaxID=2749 RepID=UPI0012F82C8B|nr:hypothetical protein [Carnobacterium gallinarum]
MKRYSFSALILILFFALFLGACSKKKENNIEKHDAPVGDLYIEDPNQEIIEPEEPGS